MEVENMPTEKQLTKTSIENSEPPHEEVDDELDEDVDDDLPPIPEASATQIKKQPAKHAAVQQKTQQKQVQANQVDQF